MTPPQRMVITALRGQRPLLERLIDGHRLEQTGTRRGGAGCPMANGPGPQLSDPRGRGLAGGYDAAGMNARHAQPAVDPRVARRLLAVAMIAQRSHQVCWSAGTF